MDHSLKWDEHIQQLTIKLSSACFALSRVASTIATGAVRACYFASVQSSLQYGIDIWGRAADWERLFRIQKRAIRIIAKVGQDTSARPYFSQLGILTLPSLLIYSVAVYVVTNYEKFSKRSDVVLYSMRFPSRLVSTSRILSKMAKAVGVMGPEVYNRLPCDIRNAPSVNVFKYKLKKWLIEKSFYSYKEFLEINIIRY